MSTAQRRWRSSSTTRLCLGQGRAQRGDGCSVFVAQSDSVAGCAVELYLSAAAAVVLGVALVAAVAVVGLRID